MASPPIAARLVAFFLALTSILGLLYFADDYFGPEDRANLVIYGMPVIALIIGAISPTKFFHRQPSKAIIAGAQIAAVPMLLIALYGDITLINGADWGAVVLRTIILGLVLLFLSVSFIGRAGGHE
jgi:hypothetical protein